MRTSSMRRGLQAVFLALAVGGSAAPTFATPLMELHAEDLLPMAPDFRKSLNLNANQQTLWQQVESRTRAILRERQSRRERIQQQAKAMLDKPDVELRELNALVGAEAGLEAAEDQQLRELWLSVNDALDDGQRRKVATFVSEQMMRVPDAPGQHGGPSDAGGGQHRRGGMGHGHGGGGGMGMPGS